MYLEEADIRCKNFTQMWLWIPRHISNPIRSSLLQTITFNGPTISLEENTEPPLQLEKTFSITMSTCCHLFQYKRQRLLAGDLHAKHTFGIA
jgi:hypothetical protein